MANHQYKAASRLLTFAQGIYYHGGDGREVSDGTIGLWCVNAGHCRKRTADVITTQAVALDLALTFQMGHSLAFCAAEKVAETMPEGLNRILFANSGSEAVGTALKIALAYHRVRGEEQHTRSIDRKRGYHGMGFGGIPVGDTSPNCKVLSANLLPGVDHLPYTHVPEHSAFSEGQPAWGRHLADELEHLVTLYDASAITAVIVKSLTGSTGVLVPSRDCLQRLRALCDKHGILLILDEVITDFCRLGTTTTVGFSGVTPDLLTTAKGISSVAVLISTVAMCQSVHDTIVDTSAPGATGLSHGYTYSIRLLVTAAMVAALDLYRSERLSEYARSLSPAFEAAAHSVKGTSHVKDIYNFDLVADIELESRPDAMSARAYEVFLRCLERSVLVHYTDDILAFFPPLIVEEAQIAYILSTVRTVLQGVA